MSNMSDTLHVEPLSHCTCPNKVLRVQADPAHAKGWTELDQQSKGQTHSSKPYIAEFHWRRHQRLLTDRNFISSQDTTLRVTIVRAARAINHATILHVFRTTNERGTITWYGKLPAQNSRPVKSCLKPRLSVEHGKLFG